MMSLCAIIWKVILRMIGSSAWSKVENSASTVFARTPSPAPAPSGTTWGARPAIRFCTTGCASSPCSWTAERRMPSNSATLCRRMSAAAGWLVRRGAPTRLAPSRRASARSLSSVRSEAISVSNRPWMAAAACSELRRAAASRSALAAVSSGSSASRKSRCAAAVRSRMACCRCSSARRSRTSASVCATLACSSAGMPAISGSTGSPPLDRSPMRSRRLACTRCMRATRSPRAASSGADASASSTSAISWLSAFRRSAALACGKPRSTTSPNVLSTLPKAQMATPEAMTVIAATERKAARKRRAMPWWAAAAGSAAAASPSAWSGPRGVSAASAARAAAASRFGTDVDNRADRAVPLGHADCAAALRPALDHHLPQQARQQHPVAVGDTRQRHVRRRAEHARPLA